MLYRDAFNNTIDHWMTELQQYSFQQLCFKPNAESWSLGQVYMHLIHETKYYILQMEACLDNTENADATMDQQARIMFQNDAFPNERILGDPVSAGNIPQPSSTVKLQQDLIALKVELNDVADRITECSFTGKTQHPGLGYFSAVEWLQYAAMHWRHHEHQKKRIDHLLLL
ncbi:MAG: DinB family protein [Cyclobacteriaceae bacterium]|nr:DinB family protein [Cyclobacteriaceae bacterium]